MSLCERYMKLAAKQLPGLPPEQWVEAGFRLMAEDRVLAMNGHLETVPLADTTDDWVRTGAQA